MKASQIVKPVLQTLAIAVIGGAWLMASNQAIQGSPAETAATPHKSVAVDSANFEQVVLKSDKLVLVDFWAEWCGPCKAIAPTLEQIANEFEGKVVVAKIDIDANPALAREYKIRAIPNLKVFKDGKVVDEIVGAAAKDRIVGKLQPHL